MEAKRVLLVDAESGCLSLAARFLKESGLEVQVCESGREAVQLAASLPFDLLITDALLPRLNGRDLAARIACLQPAIKVLFTSVFSKESLRFHGLCPQGAVCLRKPFTRDQLTAAAAAVLAAPPHGSARPTARKAEAASGVWERGFGGRLLESA